MSRLISVIIPVYNAEVYLERTLSSVLLQTYSNFEIILINDGSSDNSEKICQAFANKHDNIYLYLQENNGCKVARRHGVQKAKGEYLCFLDADDTLDPSTFELLCARLESTGADLSVGGMARVNEEGDVITARSAFRTGKGWDNEINISVKGKEELTNLALASWRYSGDGLFSSLVCRLYRKDLFEKVQEEIGDEVTEGEDFLINVKYLEHIDHIEIVNKSLYNYTMHNKPSSLSCSLINKKNYLLNFSLMTEWTADLLVHNLKLNRRQALAEARKAISYQLIGNFIYNFRYYSEENSDHFYHKTYELLHTHFIQQIIKEHVPLPGYSRFIPLLMRLKATRILIYICCKRARKRYSKGTS